jgi:hypothetical protein
MAAACSWPVRAGISVYRPEPSHHPIAPMVIASSSTIAMANRARRRRMCGGGPTSGRDGMGRDAVAGPGPIGGIVLVRPEGR